VSFFTDVSSEMIYPLIPVFLAAVLGASASAVGLVEGAAESTSALLKLASGWWSDRASRRKPLVVAGYGIATVVRPLIALATSASQVLVIRVTDRLGKGIRTAPRDALIAESVDASIRGRAFGFHRASDHAGAVVGPLVAYALLQWGSLSLRSVFALAAIPGVLAVLTLVLVVREPSRPGITPEPRVGASRLKGEPLGGGFWMLMGVLLLFTLGNSTDAFLLLQATNLGVAPALVPVLWAMLHVVKSASSTPAGALSDRIGRAPLLVSGWLVYAVVYVALGIAGAEWQVWALFAVYGVYFGLTEGVEKALVADMVPASRRGTAFGWYNLAIALGALPASVLFGALWDRYSPRVAFGTGAAFALLAAVSLPVVLRRAK
jgi:MFS family permease